MRNSLTGQSKAQLRKKFLRLRNELRDDKIEEKSRLIKKHLIALDEVKDAGVILCYLSRGSEVATNGIIDYLIKSKKRVDVPAYYKKTGDYAVVEFDGWKNLTEGPYGVLQPLKLKEIDLNSIDVAILPGVAFSKNGLRLGYGKGVFDRLLVNSSAFKVGLCFAIQVCSQIPEESYDLKMDVVVTEMKFSWLRQLTPGRQI